jgi:Cys-tRNA(Pro)/Cys-tRNA(Cys) deacylase
MSAQGTRAVDAARRAGITYTVHEYAHDARASLREGGRGYALEAVEALGIDAGRVFKTIVVSVDGRLGVAVVPADAEVDLKLVADALGGRKAAIAPPADAEKATGYVLGGISPLGTRRALPTVVDASAGGWPTIHESAGRRGLEIELSAADLVSLVKGRLEAVARRG